MSKLFQITEDDLAALEKFVPQLLFQGMGKFDDNASRTKIRAIQNIIVNVRWNYGPWSDVTEIPASDEPQTGAGK